MKSQPGPMVRVVSVLLDKGQRLETLQCGHTWVGTSFVPRAVRRHCAGCRAGNVPRGYYVALGEKLPTAPLR